MMQTKTWLLEYPGSERSCLLFYGNPILITNWFLNHDADLFLEIIQPTNKPRRKPTVISRVGLRQSRVGTVFSYL